MSLITTFKCDVCGKRHELSEGEFAEGDVQVLARVLAKDKPQRPRLLGEIGVGGTIHAPHDAATSQDVCSIQCAVKLLRQLADKIENL